MDVRLLSDILQIISNPLPTVLLILLLLTLLRHTWEFNNADRELKHYLLSDLDRINHQQQRTLDAITQDNAVRFPDCPTCSSKNNATVIALGVCADCHVKGVFKKLEDDAKAKAAAKYAERERRIDIPGRRPTPKPMPRISPPGPPPPPPPMPVILSGEWTPPVRNAVMAHEATRPHRGLGPGNAATNKGLMPPPGERKYTKPPKLPPYDPRTIQTVWRTVFGGHNALSSMLDINVEDNPFVIAMRRSGYDEYKRWKPFFNGGFPKCPVCKKTATSYLIGKRLWGCTRCNSGERVVCPACDIPLSDTMLRERKLEFSGVLQRTDYGDPRCRLCGALDMKHPDNDHNVTRRCPKCSQSHNLGIDCTACRKCGRNHSGRGPCSRANILLDNYITK